MTQGNELPSGWLLQTLNCWGQSQCTEPPPGQKQILERMTELIARAKVSVDIADLVDPGVGQLAFPNGKYNRAIIDGLKLGHQRHPNQVPLVRVLIGNFPPFIPDPIKYREDLQIDVGDWLRSQVGYMRTEVGSHNHEKVLDVDGQTAIVGGMNYWAGDYLDTKHPVNDLNMEVTGPAAAKVSQFTDLLWKWTCDHGARAGVSYSPGRACVGTIPTAPAPDDPNGIPIMVVGHLGESISVPGEVNRESKPIPERFQNGNRDCPFPKNFYVTVGNVNDPNDSRSYEYRNPGEDALRELIASAKHSVFISQQDLLSCISVPGLRFDAKFDERMIAALASRIKAFGRVKLPLIKIVVSHAPGAFEDYGNGFDLKNIAVVLKEQLMKEYGMSAGAARDDICGNVGLAYLSNDGSEKWKDGKNFHNHAKLISVDDKAFYIGSENFYPSKLQELGFIVESPAASKVLKDDYLDPMWVNSFKRSFIDAGRNVCGDF